MKFEKLCFKALGVGFKEIYCCAKLKSVIVAIVESMKKTTNTMHIARSNIIT
jgi:hypothetical protein